MIWWVLCRCDILCFDTLRGAPFCDAVSGAPDSGGRTIFSDGKRGIYIWFRSLYLERVNVSGREAIAQNNLRKRSLSLMLFIFAYILSCIQSFENSSYITCHSTVSFPTFLHALSNKFE